jgi:hypothetical protein
MKLKCEGCGKEYQPKQVWIHGKCGGRQVMDVVVDKPITIRTKDRHKKTEERKTYQKEWIKSKRSDK